MIIFTLVVMFLSAALLFQWKKTRFGSSDINNYAKATGDVVIGIFHPFADGGGGGERVLFCLIRTLLKLCEKQCTTVKKYRIVLFSGDDGMNASELLCKAAAIYDLPELLDSKLQEHMQIVYLHNRDLLLTENLRSFTLLRSIFAQISVALHAFQQGQQSGNLPGVWVETTGLPFTYIIAKFLYQCKVIAYVHYPLLYTKDITSRIKVENFILACILKICSFLYYQTIGNLYYFTGKYLVDEAMVNSRWTYERIQYMWRRELAIVYPPCGPMQSPVASNRKPWALSVSQFRPEKNHSLQLHVLHYLCKNFKKEMTNTLEPFKLIMLGNSRKESDNMRVDALRKEAALLGVEAHVVFAVNASIEQMKYYFDQCLVGLHTMQDEHFGIGIVEMMANGLITIAHNSGGPLRDIISKDTGFLATTVEEYGDCIRAILHMSESEQKLMCERARSSMQQRFSDSEFSAQILNNCQSIFLEA